MSQQEVINRKGEKQGKNHTSPSQFRGVEGKINSAPAPELQLFEMVGHSFLSFSVLGHTIFDVEVFKARRQAFLPALGSYLNTP